MKMRYFGVRSRAAKTAHISKMTPKEGSRASFRMVVCFVCGCNHRSDRDMDKKCTFRRFPQDPKMLKAWIKATRRKDRMPNKNSRVCGCHFDTNSAVPSIFPWNKDKRFNFKSPEKRIRRKNDRSFLQHTEIDARCSAVDRTHFGAEEDVGCSAVNDVIFCGVEEDVGCSAVNDVIFCGVEEDEGCSGVDGGIHRLEDTESDRPVTERLDKITSSRFNFKELQKENENLRLQISSLSTVQEELEEVKKENEYLFARIHDFASAQNELEKLKKENENLRLQISTLDTVKKELDVKKENENMRVEISGFTTVKDELDFKDYLITN